jgi:uncharacterized protein
MIAVDVLESIEEFCRSKHVIVAAYVFGSSATGKDRCGSDIDIAIMISTAMDGLERVRLETNLSNVLGKDVDLVIFDRASPLLQHQILKYGRLVYEANPKERVRQETVARRRYLESLFLYRIIDKDKAHGR